MSDFDNGFEVVQPSFCPYCGTKLDEGARFCKNCGKAMFQVKNDASAKREEASERSYRPSGNPKTRETVYEGYIHKCPNCGEVIESFTSRCPICGYEIRDTRSSNSVRELSQKLEEIEAKQMPTPEENPSLLKRMVGRDFYSTDTLDEERRKFEREKDEEKASLIKSFPIPNTKEDILDFMLIASANIDIKHLDDELVKAWIAKFEQVYQRAKLIIHNESDMAQIRAVYDEKMGKVELKKKIKVCIIGAIVLFYIILILFYL